MGLGYRVSKGTDNLFISMSFPLSTLFPLPRMPEKKAHNAPSTAEGKVHDALFAAAKKVPNFLSTVEKKAFNASRMAGVSLVSHSVNGRNAHIKRKYAAPNTKRVSTSKDIGSLGSGPSKPPM